MKKQKEQQCNNGQPSKQHCPICHLVVASREVNKIKTDSGLAHTHCANTKIARLLAEAGLPKPAGRKLKVYLEKQVEQLLDLPAADTMVKRKLVAIYEVADYLMIQFNLPSVIKEARPTPLFK